MKILIVDDIEDNRTAIELLLEEFEGLEIAHAVDGVDAVEQCGEAQFDIVFMDIMMPNMNGIEATRKIKSFDAKVMVIALSALDDEESKNRMLDAGAEDYLSKPIESELFTQRIKNYMEIVRLRKQPLKSTGTYNHFTDEVYARVLTFNIFSIAALAEFWDYYLNDTDKKVADLSDCVRLIYAYGQFMLKKGASFSIIAEENDEDLFFTLSPLESLSEMVIRHTVLKHCGGAMFILKEGRLSLRLKKHRAAKSEPAEPTDDETSAILAKDHSKNIVTASEYLDRTAVSVIDKMDSLERVEEELDRLIIDFEQHPEKTKFTQIGELFAEYADTLALLMEFEHLAFAINTLSTFMQELDASAMTPERNKKAAALLIYLLDDLCSWRDVIFVKVEANNIHYLDASLLSSCLQIEAIFADEEEAEDDDDFELF